MIVDLFNMKHFFEIINEYPLTTFLIFVAIYLILDLICTMLINILRKK